MPWSFSELKQHLPASDNSSHRASRTHGMGNEGNTSAQRQRSFSGNAEIPRGRQRQDSGIHLEPVCRHIRASTENSKGEQLTGAQKSAARSHRLTLSHCGSGEWRTIWLKLPWSTSCRTKYSHISHWQSFYSPFCQRFSPLILLHLLYWTITVHTFPQIVNTDNLVSILCT